MSSIVTTPSFRDWLISRVGLNPRSASDVESRVRRASTLTDILPGAAEDEVLLYLGRSPEFCSLSVSVRSQLRRAVRLFLEYSREMPGHLRLPI